MPTEAGGVALTVHRRPTRRAKASQVIPRVFFHRRHRGPHTGALFRPTRTWLRRPRRGLDDHAGRPKSHSSTCDLAFKVGLPGRTHRHGHATVRARRARWTTWDRMLGMERPDHRDLAGEFRFLSPLRRSPGSAPPTTCRFRSLTVPTATIMNLFAATSLHAFKREVQKPAQPVLTVPRPPRWPPSDLPFHAYVPSLSRQTLPLALSTGGLAKLAAKGVGDLHLPAAAHLRIVPSSAPAAADRAAPPRPRQPPPRRAGACPFSDPFP